MSQPTSPTIGDRGEPFELVVEAGKIREFARATKARAATGRPDGDIATDLPDRGPFWAGRGVGCSPEQRSIGRASCMARRSTPFMGRRRRRATPHRPRGGGRRLRKGGSARRRHEIRRGPNRVPGRGGSWSPKSATR